MESKKLVGIVAGLGLVAAVGLFVASSFKAKPAPYIPRQNVPNVTPGSDPNVNQNLAPILVSTATGYAPIILQQQEITLEHLRDNNGQFGYQGGYFV